MSDERVDTTIDEVVRELTAGEPGSAFTARALARIEADDRARATWRAGWVISPLALAAAIVVAVAVFRSQSTRPVQHPQPPEAAENKMTVAPGPLDRNVPQVASQLSAPSPQPPAPALDTSSRFNSSPGSDIDALALAPLDVVSITLRELEPLNSIDLEQLQSIEPIAVTPLGNNDQGDRP